PCGLGGGALRPVGAGDQRRHVVGDVWRAFRAAASVGHGRDRRRAGHCRASPALYAAETWRRRTGIQLTPSKTTIIAGALALLSACAESFGPDAGPFPVAAIKADMATLSMVPGDFDRILTPVQAVYRWPAEEIPVALVMAKGLDRTCARKTSAHLDQ